MSRSRPHGRRAPSRRLTIAALTAALVAAAAPTAHAADLLVLQGEQAQLQGANDFGIVYVDGELRLTGDTTITATSVYIGPNASLRTCYVPAAGDTCTAGRSLTITSVGPLTVEPSIDLTGRTGTVRPGGSLVLSGSDVAVGGQITTAGNGGVSGSVRIDSRGIATTGSITANGAPVTITAARNVSVNGNVRTDGSAQTPAPPGRLQGANPVSISSSGGDVAVRGDITASGRDAAATQGPGGLGADVSLGGGDVRVGSIDTTGGTSVDADAGTSGTITLAARGALHALGRLDASGGGSTNGPATGGGTVNATAGGPAALAGGVFVGGGNGPLGGAPGGTLSLEAGSVALGSVTATGGSANTSAAPKDGGAGGSVVVRSHGATSLGAISAGGGNAPAGARGGAGGSVAVTGQSISAGQVSTAAGSTAAGPGSDGGPVTLDADGSLALGGSLTTSGSGAAGTLSASNAGGNGGHVLLRAGEGTLDLGSPVWALGGRGSASGTPGVRGGPGGNGGSIDLVARTLGTIVSIVADGGDGGSFGDLQGPGGAGGAIHGFTDGPLLDDLKVVSADGGDGRPAGAAGARTVESSPASLAVSPAGLLTFASRSPGAPRFRVLRSVNGGAQEVVGETGATSLAVSGPMCVPVTFTVVALADAVRWTSNAPAAVTYTAQPSPTQRCGDPAAVTATEARVLRRLSVLRKARWRLSVPLTVAGLGHLDATLQQGRKKVLRLGTAALDLKGKGAALSFALPKGRRRAGTLQLVLVVTAPDGSKKATTTVPVEVRKDVIKKKKKKKSASRGARKAAR